MFTSLLQHRWNFCLALSFALFLCLCQVTAQSSSPPTTNTSKNQQITPANLTLDPRLDRLIDLHEIGTSLESLLQKVSTPQVALSANRLCATQKVHIYLKRRPLRLLLQSLAELLPGTWYKREEGAGYYFVMNPNAPRKRQRWWELYLAEREQALGAQRASILHAMRAKPMPIDATIGDGTDKTANEAFKAQLMGEGDIFRALPADLQEHITQQVNPVTWFTNGSHTTQASMQEGATVFALTDLPVNVQQMIAHIPRNSNAVDAPLSETLVSFENLGSTVYATLLSPQGDYSRLIGKLSGMQIAPDAVSLLLDHRQLAAVVKKLGRNAPPAWQELAKYQQTRVWPNDLPTDYQRLAYPNRIEVMEWLAEQGGIEFVSDCYCTNCGSYHVAFEPLTRSLKAELNWRAAEQDMSWKQQSDNVYLFRNNRWYRDDDLEVPAPLLRRWFDQRAQQIASTKQTSKNQNKSLAQPNSAEWTAALRAQLDWQAEVVTTLTPWQLFNGLQFATLMPLSESTPPSVDRYHQASAALIDSPSASTMPMPFYDDVMCIQMQYATLLFYTGLEERARTDVLAGRLEYSTLSPAQKSQALYVLPSLRVQNEKAKNNSVLLGLRPVGAHWFQGMRLRLIAIMPPADN